jgi:hypothetical protein
LSLELKLRRPLLLLLLFKLRLRQSPLSLLLFELRLQRSLLPFQRRSLLISCSLLTEDLARLLRGLLSSNPLLAALRFHLLS